jgi:hypothetical protein
METIHTCFRHLRLKKSEKRKKTGTYDHCISQVSNLHRPHCAAGPVPLCAPDNAALLSMDFWILKWRGCISTAPRTPRSTVPEVTQSGMVGERVATADMSHKQVKMVG